MPKPPAVSSVLRFGKGRSLGGLRGPKVFEMHLGPFGNSDNTVRKILPLYRTESGRVIEGKARANATTDRKRREIAKPGYVVAGITTHSEAGICKMKIRYEAIRGMARMARN